MAKLFISHKNEKYNLDVELIKEALEDFLIYHLNLDNHFEVSWVLWLFKQLEITLSENVAKEISKNNNSIVALTALDVYISGYIPKGLDTTGWKWLLSRDSLYNENWLFAYESIKKGWLSTKEDFISKEPFFRLLRDNNVEFYDEYNDADLSNIKVTSNDASLLKYRDDSGNQKDNKDDGDEFDIDKILEDMEF